MGIVLFMVSTMTDGVDNNGGVDDIGDDGHDGGIGFVGGCNLEVALEWFDCDVSLHRSRSRYVRSRTRHARHCVLRNALHDQ